MRRAWVLAAIAGLVCVVLLLLDRQDGDAPLASPEATPDVREVPTLHAAGREKPKTPSPVQAELADTPAGTQEPTPPRIQGTLVIREVDGTEVPADGCEVEIQVVGDPWAGDAKVKNGRWTFDFERGARVRIGYLVDRRRGLVLVDAQRDKVFETNAPVALIARPVRPTVLRVRDGNTGADLANVRVLRADDWEYSVVGHPGDTADVETIRGSSPLEVAPLLDDGYWRREEPTLVHSPGYAWGRIDIDYRMGTERILDLFPGGDLDLRITGAPAPRGTHLRIRKKNAEETWEVFVEYALRGKSGLQVAALPPGAYTMRAEIGSDARKVIVLGSGTFDVAAGRTTSSTLELRRLERPKPVLLAGELHLAQGWFEKISPHALRSLRFDFLDVPLLGAERSRGLSARIEPVAGRPGVWRFDAGKLQPGRYQVVHGSGYRTGLKLEGNRRNARISVPPPVEVTVRVVDPKTGSDVPTESISWHMQMPAGATMVSPATVEDKESTGRFVFTAPAGKILVHAWTEGFETGYNLFDVREGNRELLIRAERKTTLFVLLRHGERAFETIELEAKKLGADGDVETLRWQGSPKVSVLEPGRYRIQVKAPEGFETVKPRDVEVRAGETVRIEIDLRPKR